MVAQIQMVDLISQYLAIKEEIDEAMAKVVQKAHFIRGPQVRQFADHLADYLGIKFVIPCANGTDALQIALMALDLKPGDEVIVPAFTYAATAEVIGLLGLVPAMIDVNPQSFNLDETLLSSVLSDKTKAIVPVHLFGQCANMEPIMNFAKKHNLFVVEDNAQAIGASYSFSDGSNVSGGGIGHIGTTSFFPSKNLGCFGDGGALMSNDEALAEKVHVIGNHGQYKKYEHTLIGVNSRLDTIQAAVLDVKLKYLSQYASARQKAANYYDHQLADDERFTIPFRQANSTHVFHQYTLKLNGIDRSHLQSYLSENGIPSMVYYPLPLHFQEAYASEKYKKGSFPVSEKLSKQVLSLPMSTELHEEQLAYICKTLKNYKTK